MGSLELSASQRQTLTALVNGYQQSERPVKGDRIAELVDRTPGTVRNQMQHLKSLGLVEGVPGPKGGYEPTEAAFEVLGREDLEERATVTLSGEYERVDVTVSEIDFPNVNHPEECTARVRFQASARHVEVGDPVVVGPTPRADLVVGGRVQAVNDTADEVLLDVSVLEAPVTPE